MQIKCFLKRSFLFQLNGRHCSSDQSFIWSFPVFIFYSSFCANSAWLCMCRFFSGDFYMRIRKLYPQNSSRLIACCVVMLRSRAYGAQRQENAWLRRVRTAFNDTGSCRRRRVTDKRVQRLSLDWDRIWAIRNSFRTDEELTDEYI